MPPAPGVTLHDPKHATAQEEDSSISKRPKTKLPPIPDLRFEYSYFKSIQPFVKITRVERKVQETEREAVVVVEDSPREIIEIEWKQVLWVTLKDQLMSPFLQGTLWGFASSYLKPLSARLGFGSTTSIARRPSRDGEGVSWLRNRWQRLGFRSSGQSSPSTA